ncbi:hypothetical protein SK128_006566 [Halocaridina rubra]|uniref:Sulfotransferase n=1 Tax=Halocaridina rubra TaxID=373956 RepID=A0AAN8ZSU4_HALRR
MLWPELWDTSDMNRNINASVAVQFLRDVLLCKFAKYPEYVRYIFIEMRFYGNEFFYELCPDYTGGYCESLDLLTTLCMAFKTHVVKIVRLHIRNAFEILEERIPVFTAVERNYTNERSKANSTIAKERNLLQFANVYKLRNYSIKADREKLRHNFSSGKIPDNVGEELYVNVSKGHLAKTSNQVPGGALPLNYSLHPLAKLSNQVDGEKITLNTPKDPVAKLFNQIFTNDLTLNASKDRSANFPNRDDEQVSLNASRYQTANLSMEEMRLKLIPLEMFNYLSPERYAYFRSFFQENAFIDPKHFPVVQKNIKIVHLVRDPRGTIHSRKDFDRVPQFTKHQGHSRTIIGVEQLGGNEGGIRLLVMDPSHSPTQVNQLVHTQTAPSAMRLLRKPLSSMRAKQYQMVAVIGLIETEQEYKRSKILQASIRIPKE